MRKAKKFIGVMLTMVMVLLMVACAPAAQQEAPQPAPAPAPAPAPRPVAPPVEEIQEMEMGMATAHAPGHIMGDVATKFKEIVEERSDGNITVNLFLGGALGSEEDILKSVTTGAVEGQSGGGLIINAYAPPFFFIDTPFVMQDWDHIMAVWDGELGDRMRATVEAAGNTTMTSLVYRGFRHFTANRAVATPEDLPGLKLRLPVLPAWVAVWEAMGASPIPIPLGELYTALATGVVDASEGDLTQIQGLKLNEIQTHLSLTHHLIAIGVVRFNTHWLNDLNEPTRNLIIEAANEAALWGSNSMKAKEGQIIRDLEALGMEVVESDIESFRTKGMPAIERLFQTQFRVTTFEEVQEYAR